MGTGWVYEQTAATHTYAGTCHDTYIYMGTGWVYEQAAARSTPAPGLDTYCNTHCKCNTMHAFGA